jgi:hypothetical protein
MAFSLQNGMHKKKNQCKKVEISYKAGIIIFMSIVRMSLLLGCVALREDDAVPAPGKAGNKS